MERERGGRSALEQDRKPCARFRRFVNLRSAARPRMRHVIAYYCAEPEAWCARQDGAVLVTMTDASEQQLVSRRA